MGEKETKPFQLTFNGLLKVDFQGSHVTSDGACFRNQKNFITAIYFHCGGLELAPSPT